MAINTSYTVVYCEYGIIIRGPIPVGDFSTLAKAWAEHGFDTIPVGFAQALNANFVVCRKEDMKAWQEQIERQAKEASRGDVELEWLKGSDTGISSRTIFSVLAGNYKSIALISRPDVLHDPSDFGRCYRLLERFPHWKARLPEVAARYPEWEPFVEAWDRMVLLWEEESPTGKCPKLWGLMEGLKEKREL